MALIFALIFKADYLFIKSEAGNVLVLLEREKFDIIQIYQN